LRQLAVLFMPALAVLGVVCVLAITTGVPQSAIPGMQPAFEWKGHSFTSKGQFERWLDSRDVTYAGWRKRHPGAKPPWEEDNNGLLYLAFVTAVAGGVAWLVRTHDSVGRIAKEKLSPILGRLASLDVASAAGPRQDALLLREAVSVYGVRPNPPPEPPSEPELLLVDASETVSVRAETAEATGEEDAAASTRQRRRRAAGRRRPEPLVEVPSDLETAVPAERPSRAAEDPVAPGADKPRPPGGRAPYAARHLQLGDERFALLLEHSDPAVREVTCRVQNPDGIESAARCVSVLLPRQYGLVYPNDFRGAPPLSEGMFRVEWLASGNDRGPHRLLAALEIGATGQDADDDF
jgi:hypothetical protein